MTALNPIPDDMKDQLRYVKKLCSKWGITIKFCARGTVIADDDVGKMNVYMTTPLKSIIELLHQKINDECDALLLRQHLGQGEWL